MATTKQDRQNNRSNRLGTSTCFGRGNDTHVLQDTANSMYNQLPPPSVNDLIMQYNGDKYRLAYELTRQKLGNDASVEDYQREYKNVLGDLNRYIRKARTPNTPMQERFKKLYLPQSRKALKVQIRGCVNVSNDWYYKDSTWGTPIIVPASQVNAFIKLAMEDNYAAYLYLNGIYMKTGIADSTINWLNNVQINMSF